MTAAAAAVTSLRLYRSWARLPRGSPAKRQRLPLLLTAAAAAGMMANCLALDPLLCAVAGPWMGTTSLLFAGSALGFAAIVALAAAEERAMASAAGKRQ